jgi:hypothetical protein
MLIVAFSSTAYAQDPNDILLMPKGLGLYEVKMQTPSDTDLDECGLDRVDVDPAVELHRFPATPDTLEVLNFQVPVTPRDDADIKGWCVDLVGNKSEFSVQVARADFTPPGRPGLSASLGSALRWIWRNIRPV